MKLPFLILSSSAAIGLMLTNTSCTPTQEGAAIGGALGAGVGGAVTDSVDGALIGGLFGAAAGAVIGDNAYKKDHYYGRRGYGPPPGHYRGPRNGYRGPRRGYGY